MVGWKVSVREMTEEMMTENVAKKINLPYFKCHRVYFVASPAGLFRGARLSSLATNACSTENNIPFALFYLRGK